MINHGDGTFTITNKKTGETRRVQSGELSKYGLQTPRDEGAFEGAITKTGLFDVPLAGGVIRALTHPLLKGAETVAQAGGELATAATGGTQAPQFVSPSMQNTLNQRKQTGIEGFVNPDAVTGDIATTGVKTAAGVGAYGIPGGGFVGGISGKGLAGAGGLASFGESGNTIGQTVGETALGAALGPVLGKIPGEIGKLTKGTFSTLFEKAPTALRKKSDLVEKQLVGLENSYLTDLVGYKNIAKARTLGINVTHSPEDVIRIITPEMEAIGDDINQTLGREYANATIGELTEAFVKAQRQVVPGVKEINLKDFSRRTKQFLQQNILDSLDEVGPTLGTKGQDLFIAGKEGIQRGRIMGEQQTTSATIGQQLDFTNDATPISLNIVNKIKQRLGERFEDDPLYKQAYKNLQELIENNSGQKELVKSLNQEYNTLREIKNTATQRLEKGTTSLMENFEVRRDILKNKPFQDPWLGVAATIASLGTAGGLLLGPAGGAIGAMPGGSFALYRLFANMLKDPNVARRIATTLEKPAEAMGTPIGQVVGGITGKASGVIGKALEQAGVRLPSRL